MNTTWNNGYQTTVNYTYGYYRDLSPNYQRFCMLLKGVDCPLPDQSHTHCELGFGQGVSINVHAATSDNLYWGTDFNPAHAAQAQKIAKQSQVQQYFFDDSFEEFLNRQDLPLFDSISLHGIWSWISYENQLIILKFIRKYLKPSGIVYISYNCSTGWAANMPIRELFYSHYKFNSKSNSPTQKVKDALSFSRDLFEQKPLFLQRHPSAQSKLERLEQENPNYLIHEYLNQDWQCFSFQQIVHLFEDIKLSFAGTTDLLALIDDIHLTKEQQQFLEQIDHPIFKEQCRDYFVSNQFRRDLFVRGKNNLNLLEVKERLRNTAFVFLSKENLPTVIQGGLGQFDLRHELYVEIARKFTEHQYQPMTLMQLEQLTQFSYHELIDALVILCHFGVIQPCQPQMPTNTILSQSQALNRYVASQAKFHNNYQVLANPYTGMGIVCGHLSMLFYYAYFIEQQTNVDQIAEVVQQVFDDLGVSLLDDQRNSVTNRVDSLKLLREKWAVFLADENIEIAKALHFFD